MPHPIPLHPDADLALVLADLRQNVAEWGDEGLVMRVFRAGICLMLLSILDTLIELLADFRVGRLPPLLPAYDEIPNGRTTQATLASAGGSGESKLGAAPRHSRAPRIDDAHAAPPDASEQSDAARAIPAPCRVILFVPPPRLPVRHPEHEPRGAVFRRSHVSRWPSAAFGEIAGLPKHVYFVPI